MWCVDFVLMIWLLFPWKGIETLSFFPGIMCNIGFALL